MTCLKYDKVSLNNTFDFVIVIQSCSREYEDIQHQKLVTDVYIEKSLKKWIKKCIKIENAHIKASSESVQSKN